MERYLILDVRNAAICAEALAVCNESESWIHGAITTEDERVGEWTRRAGVQSLTLPAIIRLEDDGGVHVVVGEVFRWRVFQVLGPEAAGRLRQMVSENGPNGAARQGRGEVARAARVAKSRPAGPINRRRFMGMASSDES